MDMIFANIFFDVSMLAVMLLLTCCQSNGEKLVILS